MSRCHGSLTRKLDSESQADLPVTVTAGTGRIARRRTVTVTVSGLTECPARGPRPAATQSRRRDRAVTAAGVTGHRRFSAAAPESGPPASVAHAAAT